MVLMYGQSSEDSRERPISVDTKGMPITIDTIHEKVHDGELFTFTDQVSTTTASWFIVVPNTSTEYHLEGIILADGAMNGIFAEGATISSAGTTLTAFNNNRNSTNTTLLECQSMAALSGTGIVIQYFQIGSAATPSRNIGGEARSEAEWILKQNEKYLLQVSSATTQTATLVLQFYER